MLVAQHKVVTIDYTLRDPEGAIIDTSKDNGPLAYIHGMGNLISGLEAALEGKTAGDSLNAVISPADGYGEWDGEKIEEVDRSNFKGIDDLQVGMQFTAGNDDGEYVVTVTKIEGDTVTIDGNHPLAGVTLNFDVKIVGVRDATKEEMEHGHVHGPDGHHHH